MSYEIQFVRVIEEQRRVEASTEQQAWQLARAIAKEMGMGWKVVCVSQDTRHAD